MRTTARSRFHLIDTKDPIAATIAQVFPELFKPLSAMPEDLRTRLRYPQGIFSLQAAMFATFHMTNPSTFYNREDQWDVAFAGAGRGDARPMAPYYTIMKLPGEEEAEYIQMLPYTPRQKDNLAAWMVARSDGENYGQADGVPVPEADGDLRPAPGRRAHQPGSGDRAADHAVEPAGLGSDPGQSAGDSDRGVAALHPAALPARRGRAHSGAEARRRGVSEPHRHGRDAGRRRSSACSRRRTVDRAPRRDPRNSRSHRQAPPQRLGRATAARTRTGSRAASATDLPARDRSPARPATGPSTAKRSSASAKSCSGFNRPRRR